MAKLVYIVGCDHQMQAWNDPEYPERNQQVEYFLQDLKTISSRYRPDVYCEEIDQRAHSVMEQLATKRRRRYVNINTPREVQHDYLSIPRDYATSQKYNPLEVAVWHACREDYMFRRAKERFGPETVALVVCGQMHLSALTNRFRRICCQVIPDDILGRSWYRGEVFTAQFYFDKAETHPFG